MSNLPVHSLSAEFRYTGRQSKRFFVYEIEAGSAVFTTIYLRKEIINGDPPPEIWAQIKFEARVPPDDLEIYQTVGSSISPREKSDRQIAERAAQRVARHTGQAVEGEDTPDETGDQ